RLYNRRLLTNGLGGQGHVCEKSSRQEEGRRQEEAGQEAFGYPLREQGQAQVRPQAVDQEREVSEAHEHQEGLEQADRSQGSTQTIREEDHRNRTEEA